MIKVNLKPYSTLLRDLWPYGLLILLWTVAWAAIGNNLLIPDPVSVLRALVEYVNDHRFQLSIWTSFSTLLLAWFLVQLLLLVTLILQFHPVFRTIFIKWAVLFQTLPSFSLLPVMIVLLGFGPSLLYSMIIFTNYWVGTNYMMTAVTQSQARWHTQCQNLRWNIIEQIRHVYLYSMLPYLINIASITWGLCWRTLIAMEVMFGGLGSQLGLGVLMQEDRMTYDIAEIWAVLLTIIMISVTVDQIFQAVRRRIHWS